jgi:putative zinc finger protein
MHLDDEQLQRLMHGELAPKPEAEVRDHLARCAECRSLTREAEREEARLFGLLDTMDHSPPSVTVQSIRARAGGRSPVWGRWAAGLILGLVGAGAAYAAPGSPLPALVGRVIDWANGTTRTPAPSPEPEVGAAAGITVAPGQRFTILFSRSQVGGMATITLTDSADIMVRALHGIAAFSSDVDRLSIDNGGDSSRFEILIPRSAPSVDIRVNGRQVFRSQNSRVITAAALDSEGRYVLPLGIPKP